MILFPIVSGKVLAGSVRASVEYANLEFGLQRTPLATSEHIRAPWRPYDVKSNRKSLRRVRPSYVHGDQQLDVLGGVGHQLLPAKGTAEFSVPQCQVRNPEIYTTISAQVHLLRRPKATFPEIFPLFLRRHLKKLNLTGNHLTVVPRPLEEATSLEYLSLDGNPIHIINYVNGFPKMPQLKELSLRNMPNLTEIGKGGLSGLTSLENLYVQNCKNLWKIHEYAIATKVRRSRTYGSRR